MELKREILVQALTGSRNYMLETEESDWDYKVFTAPTFKDMYWGHYYKDNILTKSIDRDIKDIRQLPMLLWKSNIAYLEILFSNVLLYDKSNDSINELFSLKEEIAKMNLPKLFNATSGMFIRRKKLLDKGTEGTQHLVDKYGYDTKEAMHMFRTLFILVEYHQKGYTNFADCIRHDSIVREIMLDIKNGKYTKDEFLVEINHYHDHHFMPLKEHYHSFEPDEDLLNKVNGLVENVVEEAMFKELYENSH